MQSMSMNYDSFKKVSLLIYRHDLSEGENILSAKILRADEQTKPGNRVGINCLLLQ